MVTAGANMAFMHAVLAVTSPGDDVIVPLPFYFNHEMAIVMAGCRAVPVPTDINYQLDLDAIRAALTPRTRVIVTVSPNNPSGAVLTEASLRALNDLCRERCLYHVSDETYEYFTYGSARHVSALSFPGAAPHTFARLRSPQWMATIGADLILFTALHIASPGSSINYTALFILPVLMAGVLTPRVLALATAAAATLALLVAAWLKVILGGDLTILMGQAALAGSGFFVITILAGELAGRLAREELSARGSLELARQQAQLNRLVIEEMEDGVLVVDRAGKVRAANPAARRLLAPEGTSRPAPFQLRGVPAWGALVAAVERAFAEASWPEVGRDVPLQFAPDAHRTLRVRVRFTRKREPTATEEFCVLFLEDVRNVQTRSRQEKLAAMGRVSAGIAHEIRNPLAAISQANALLSEDATDPAQRQLMHMVTENVERLKRIVDDVLEVAPGQVQEVGAIDATAQIAAFSEEWAKAAGMPTGAAGILRLDLPSRPLGVLFDAEHLRRVLVNLLDNARRHADEKPGAIVVRLQSTPDSEARAVFSVLSDGPPIPAEVEPYLFEPFFSTRSRGAGLGLYICRELCERYGARIDYRLLPPGQRHRNDFFVDMRRGALQPADARLHLTP